MSELSANLQLSASMCALALFPGTLTGPGRMLAMTIS